MKNGDVRKFSVILLILITSNIFGQNLTEKPVKIVLLSDEISRLEKLSRNGTDAKARYEAFLALVRLHQLSGNPEESLKSLDAALAILPGGGLALLEKGRLLISLGEYEKAAEAVAALLTGDREKGVLLEARYLMALLEAFRSGNTRLLSALPEEGDFAKFRSGIYYALWRLEDNTSWKTRLIREFPKSPEAIIAGNLSFAAQTPLWLLFPGRDSVRLTDASAAALAVEPTAPTVATTPAAAPTAVPTDGAVLQTGLFSQEENARDLVSRLQKAGFAPGLQQRLVNDVIFWAVIVPGGRDAGAVAKKLKDAGFDSFPVKL